MKVRKHYLPAFLQRVVTVQFLLVCFAFSATLRNGFSQPSILSYQIASTFEGAESGARLGVHGLFRPGDLNDDSIEDFLVASGFATVGGLSNAGSLHLLSGSDGAPLFSISGEDADDGLGRPGVLFPGDLNNDGVNDFIVGLRGGDVTPGGNEGSALIISGLAPYSIIDSVGNKYSNDVLDSLTLLGDINNDSIDDFALISVNARSDSLVGGTGRTRFFSGADRSLIYEIEGSTISGDGRRLEYITIVDDVNSDGRRDYLFRGDGIHIYSGLDGSRIWFFPNEVNQVFSSNILVAGDLNGDNIDDIVAFDIAGDTTANALTDEGVVVAISGADGSEIFRRFGERNGSSPPRMAVYLPGDLNGDNRDDVLAVYPFTFDVPIAGTGRVNALNGSTGAVLWQANEATRSGFGLTATIIEDLNNDAVKDFVVSAANNGGIVRILSGSDGNAICTNVGRPGDAIGNRAVTVIGDVNGDSRADILAVAPGGNSLDDTETGVGVYRVISGLDCTTLHETRGDRSGDNYGLDNPFFELPGDVDADGIPDYVAFSNSVRAEVGLGSVGGFIIASGIDSSRIIKIEGELRGSVIPPSPVLDNQGTSLGLKSSPIQSVSDLNGDLAPDFIRLDSNFNSGRGSVTFIHSFDLDECPEDPAKQFPGICGCGIADVDTDEDTVFDCLDLCPNDPAKTASQGDCGCGVSEDDADSDGTKDCVDECPADSAKVESGVCGCGQGEFDADGDQLPDCVDLCPASAFKTTSAGVCGCDVADEDLNQNGIIDCLTADELHERVTDFAAGIEASLQTKGLSAQDVRPLRRLLRQVRRIVPQFTVEDPQAGVRVRARVRVLQRRVRRLYFLRRSRKRTTKRFARIVEEEARELPELIRSLANLSSHSRRG